jgi:hypothetical protein
MPAEILYEDRTSVLDAEGVTLKRYYFPTGRGKHIPYGQIRAAQRREMGWFTGRLRQWGSEDLKSWLPFELARFRKHELVVLDTGKRIKPAFSPDDPARVLEILTAHA